MEELTDAQSAFGQEEVGEFVSTIQELSISDAINSILESVSCLFPEIDLFHAAMLSILCGSLVENGGSPSITADAIVAVLIAQLLRVKECPEHEPGNFELFPDTYRANAGLQFTITAAMAMLCRDIEIRKKWQQHQGLVELVDENENLPYYLGRVLTPN